MDILYKKYVLYAQLAVAQVLKKYNLTIGQLDKKETAQQLYL